MISLAVQKFISLIRSHLFIFGFIFITFGGGFKKILLLFMSKSILPVFSSKSFIVSSLKLRALIYFEFIFVYGVRECSNFLLLHVAVQFSKHHLLSVQLFVTLSTISHQAPLSVEFSRQEYWSGLSSPSQEIFPTQGLNLGLLQYRQILYHLSHQGSPTY